MELGTRPGGFGNTEYFVDLKPHEQWRPGFHKSKKQLIAAMNRALEKYPGAICCRATGPAPAPCDDVDGVQDGVKEV